MYMHNMKQTGTKWNLLFIFSQTILKAASDRCLTPLRWSPTPRTDRADYGLLWEEPEVSSFLQVSAKLTPTVNR